MTRPFLLLGTPNSGTDWLARCLVQATCWQYFEKEFFNPLTNPAAAPRLLDAFGCEMMTGLAHLGTSDQGEVLRVVEKTWPKGQYQLNKEVWSFAKLPALAQFFNCLVITRHAHSLFPPGRLRVWQWYDAIWHALAPAGLVDVTITHPRERARAGYEAATAWLRTDAEMHGVHCLDYDELVDADLGALLRICEGVAERWPVDPRKLAEAILQTRRRSVK